MCHFIPSLRFVDDVVTLAHLSSEALRSQSVNFPFDLVLMHLTGNLSDARI